MKVVRNNDRFAIDASAEELRIMSQALNEICNGAHLQEWDFQTRMGAEREEARAVLRSLVDGYRA